jgi:predicted RNase H-like HicB family nuclease
MAKVTVIIEKSTDGGYGIYVPNADGLFGYGLTEEEAKEALQDAVDSQVEYYMEQGIEVPAMLTNLEFEYKYDFSAFFQSFPFINVSEFARTIGINPSLMRRYKERLAFASEKQKAIIQTKFNEIINKMSTVQF